MIGNNSRAINPNQVAHEQTRQAQLTFRTGEIVEAKYDEKGAPPPDSEQHNWTNEDENGSYRGPLYQVQFDEEGDNKCYWIPQTYPRMGEDQFEWSYEKGEQVLVCCENGDPEKSFILGALPHDGARPPVGFDDGTPDKRSWRPGVFRIRFKDDTLVEYDREKHRLLIQILGNKDFSIEMNGDSEELILKAPKLKIEGDFEVDGNINATGSIMAGGANTNHHKH